MDVETTISKNIRIADDGAKYDAACKKLLSEKIILAWIMKSCLEEYRNFDVNEIAEKYIEGTPQIAEVPVAPDETNMTLIHGEKTEDKSMTEGTITYDIRFLAIVPVSKEYIRLIINVEVQNNFYPGYPLVKRGLYYCSRMISSQYGVEFTDSHYENIKKVYSIWICLNPPKKWRNSITRYSITEENLIGNVKEKKVNYDIMTAVMVFLGSEEDENYKGILKLLEVLLSGEKKPREKKQILEEDFKIQMTQKLEREVSLVCNLSEGIIEKAMAKGMSQGIEQGIVQGKKEGVKNAILNLMKNMKLSLEQAMEVLGIPEMERVEYMEMINKNRSEN